MGFLLNGNYFFQKFGLAGSPVTEPSSGNKDVTSHVGCFVSLFCLFLFCFCLAGRFFSSLMKINLTGKVYTSTVSIKKDLPLDSYSKRISSQL